jgi:hypothetical protein
MAAAPTTISINWASSGKTLTNTPDPCSTEKLSSLPTGTNHPGGDNDVSARRSASIGAPVPDPDELEATLQAIEDESVWPKDSRAWLALFGGFLLMFNSWGLVNTYGTYQSFYYQHLTPSTSLLKLNLIGSTQCFVVLVLSNPVGRFLDAGFGRYFILCGACILTVGIYTLSVVVGDGGRGEGNYALIWLTQGLVQGLGMSCFFVPSSQIAATWFVKRKSTAVGIVASGASIGKLTQALLCNTY